LIAIFETTLIFFTQSALETGVAKAGRMIRTGQVQSQGLSESQFKTAVCDSLAGYLDCNGRLTIDVRSFSNFASVVLPPALDENDELAGGTTFVPGNTSEVVVVRAFYVWDMITPDHITGLSNMSGGKRLIAAASAFRNEPF
jgi:Flp pilus assembly protein TadG